MVFLHRSRFTAFAGSVLLTIGLATNSPAADNPALAGYADYAEFQKQIEDLAQFPLVQVSSLGQTLGGRDIYLLTMGAGKAEEKPAVFIVGNVHAPHVVGSELAVRMARELVERAKKDEAIEKLLERFTLYIVPRPSPDATEKNFLRPYREQVGNLRPTDDDRDATVGEDPPQDLNGDGWITQMRIRDDRGTLIPHPDDPRVLITADPQKGERGMYRLLTEGRDADGDEEFAEDGSDGVALNRNFTFKYPFFQRGAGPHQVSEIESRALADFAFDHMNIALVFCFSLEENLMNPWKPNAMADKARIKTNLLSVDAPPLDALAAKYRKIHGGKDAPSSPAGAGSFSEWAYFHYGRWSLAARGWWVPTLAEAEGGENKTSGEKRGSDQLQPLRWLDQQKIDGFVRWSAVKHPDFPGQTVEVGGLKPFYQLNPPKDQLNDLGEKHVRFLVEVLEQMPRIDVRDGKVESLGSGVYRITAAVVNDGALPTFAEMGEVSEHVQPVQIELSLPKGSQFIKGSARSQIKRLAGNGGRVERTWLVRVPSASNEHQPITLKAWAPAVGKHELSMKLAPQRAE